MFTPPAFAETDPDAVAGLIARAGMGVLVTAGPQGLFASHLPWLHDRTAGVLTGHLARANPHRSLAGDGEALVIFAGPQGYVSPSWYPSKAVDGRQVPTWNYEAAHVRGRLEWFDDPVELRAVVAAQSDLHEAGRPAPWSLDDAPADYVERLLRGIVGVRLRVSSIQAKRKLGQTKDAADRAGVVAGLEATGAPGDAALAAAMRALG